MTRLSNTHEREGSQATLERRTAPGAPFHFYSELFVEHSLAEVWSCFSDLARWAAWSPICRGCRLIHRGELRLGSTLEIRLRILGLTLTIPVRVVQFDPPESITWQGEKFGVRASHTYSFIPHQQGTLLCNHEAFYGARFPLNSLIAAWFRLGKVSNESLRGLRRELGEARPGCNANC